MGGKQKAQATTHPHQKRSAQPPGAYAERMNNHSGRGRVSGLPAWDRCAVMGVVNVTPDSFSDGGRWFDTTSAVKHGLDLVAEGADLVDVGGESTRPGATRVDEAEELRRVVPVVRGLAAEGVTVSVDTMRASVAEQALAAGAVLVNDVSGGLADPAMIPVVADAGVPFVVMHWRGFLATAMNNRARVRGRRRRGRRRTARARGRRASPAVSPPTGSSSTRASASPRAPITTWPSLAHLDRLRGAGPPPAGRRLPQAVPGPRTGRPRGRPAARAGTRRGHRRRLRARRPPGRLGGPRARGARHRRRGTGRPRRRGGPRRRSGPQRRGSPVSAPHIDVEQVELANTAFYEALEHGDLDELSALWLPRRPGRRRGVPRPGGDRRVSCVHPGWPVLTGRGEVLRSYALIMANTEYIQFFLTDVRGLRHRRHRPGDLHREHPQRRPRPEDERRSWARSSASSSSPPTCSAAPRTAGNSGRTTAPRSWPRPTRTTDERGRRHALLTPADAADVVGITDTG